MCKVVKWDCFRGAECNCCGVTVTFSDGWTLALVGLGECSESCHADNCTMCKVCAVELVNGLDGVDSRLDSLLSE